MKIAISVFIYLGITTSILSTPIKSDTIIIKNHFQEIAKKPGFRNYQNLDRLNQTADYIHTIFNQYSDTTFEQAYQAEGDEYRNVIASFGTENQKRIIVGAHYDVCGDQEGADDNASGVIALLELARMLKGKKLSYRIDLVAYSLEEPPFFRSESMGSYIHAQSLADIKDDIFGMISVEMIGYFKDEKKSQDYPLGLLSLFYGNKGDYITLVKKFRPGKFVRKFTKRYKATRAIRTKKFTGPAALPGIDFSDHLNYWKMGISALMITDTSFYRNKNYHKKTDIVETLDINRMAQVIDGLYEALNNL